MNAFLKALCGLVLALAAATAYAHGGVRFGFSFGVPVYGPWYYPPPYYYPPPVVMAPAAPPVYVEPPRADAAPAPQPQEQWWYYCADTKTFYPYVQSCASEWQRVPPRPPGT